MIGNKVSEKSQKSQHIWILGFCVQSKVNPPQQHGKAAPWVWELNNNSYPPCHNPLDLAPQGSLQYCVKCSRLQWECKPCGEPSSLLNVTHGTSSSAHQKPVQWCICSPCALCWRAPPCGSWGQGRESSGRASKHSRYPQVIHHLSHHSLQGDGLWQRSGKCGSHELNQAI